MAKRAEGVFEIMQGVPIPLGVSFSDGWFNFAVNVRNGNECRLNLYSRINGEKVSSIPLTGKDRTGDVFAVRVKLDNPEDYEYMYQVKEREFPDPYAKVLFGRRYYGKRLSREEKLHIRGGFAPSGFEWTEEKEAGVRCPLPYSQLIIYKLNVRGFTMHSSSQVKDKGTFSGVVQKIGYLRELGINCVQLMPIYEYNEIMESGGMAFNYKVNYWGYSGDNYYFAPKASYTSDPEDAVRELKFMVDSLHRNGIEVIMEMNFTPGTEHGLIQDCLRYWSLEYHIDGFTLNCEAIPAALLALDPILGRTKLLSEGWNSNQIYMKDFEPGFIKLAEYNNGFSTDVKRFLKADEEQVKAFAFRISRLPDKTGVVNYITNHDGFTLMDLYSYDQKHNEANGENNHDGADYNYSWNCGEEGITKKKKVNELRRKQIRNAFMVLLFSQGTPLILAGDEFGNSQQGNNNAYCQDNEIAWLNWDLLKQNEDICSYVKQLIAIRKEHPILHMDFPLRNMDYISCGFPDISFHGVKAWYPDYSHYSRILGVMLSGRYARINRKENDRTFYLAFNMHWEKHEFDLPKLPDNMQWHVLADTTEDRIRNELKPIANQKQYLVNSRSAVVFVGK